MERHPLVSVVYISVVGIGDWWGSILHCSIQIFFLFFPLFSRPLMYLTSLAIFLFQDSASEVSNAGE